MIGTGRLNGLSHFDAIAQTIDGRSILNTTQSPKASIYR